MNTELARAIAGGRVGGNLGKLIKTVGNLTTARETIQKTGLDFTVTKHQHLSALPDANGAFNPVDSYGVYRDDTKEMLGQVGSGYTVIQNIESFDFVDNLLEVEGAHYVGAGQAENGGQIFCVASLGNFDIRGDEHSAFVIFRDFKNGRGSADVKLSVLRKVCDNGLHVSSILSQSRFRHTKNVSRRMEAVSTESVLRAEIGKLTGKFDALVRRKFSSQEQVQNILNRLFPLPPENAERKNTTNLENQVRILENFESNDNNAFPEQRNTPYALYQAYSNFVDHSRQMRVTGGRVGQEIEYVRAFDSVFGKGAQDKVSALDMILENAMSLQEIQRPIYSSNSVLLDDILSN